MLRGSQQGRARVNSLEESPQPFADDFLEHVRLDRHAGDTLTAGRDGLKDRTVIDRVIGESYAATGMHATVLHSSGSPERQSKEGGSGERVQSKNRTYPKQ